MDGKHKTVEKPMINGDFNVFILIIAVRFFFFFFLQ